MVYADRAEAGRALAASLARLREERPLIYGLPRGGVPVAAEAAAALGAPLEALPARKVGLPWYPELAMGAVAPGAEVLIESTIAEFGVARVDVEAAVRREREAVERRRALFSVGPEADPRGRAVIVVDDGLATGATMVAAVRSLTARGAARVIAAAPVGSEDAVAWLAREADAVVCPRTPRPFSSVGQWYDRFDQVDDEEVLAVLRAAAERVPKDSPSLRSGVTGRSNGICEGQTPPPGAWGTMEPGGAAHDHL